MKLIVDFNWAVLACATACLLAACDDERPFDPGFTTISEDSTDLPIKGIADELVARFDEGDAAFDLNYLDPDGLGPNFIRGACSGCHKGAAKGPGTVQKMALVDTDGITPLVDQSPLLYGNTVRPYFGGGATSALSAPTSLGNLKVSLRIGVAVFGRGYLEAIEDSEIERMETAQATRSDGIAGRINRVTFTSQANPETRFHQHFTGETGLIGRFGLKARVATLDDFAADAAQGDMSITSPMRPTELANPGGLTDDHKPGVDVSIDVINLLADYMRLLAIPRRQAPSVRAVELFAAVDCAVCHAPSLRTRADYPLAPLANVDAPVFTDLLLHDMGPAFADGVVDQTAGSRQWRTAPLIGLRFFRNYLHDGRAKTVEEAITMHGADGSEAKHSVALFNALSASDRGLLVEYVSSL